jgi:hypothetical protein
MAKITRELNTIDNKWFGHEIRFPIHDAIEKINIQLEEQNAGIKPEEEEKGDDDNAGH